MSDGFHFLDILFFALIALFIILRLRSVLGRRTGNERKHPNTFARSSGRAEERPGNVVHMPGRTSRQPEEDEIFEHEEPSRAEPEAEPAPSAPRMSQDVRAGLTQIKVADPAFDARDFAHGARQAYGMITEAYASGDTATLRPLLGDDIYDRFAAEIRARLAAEKKMDVRINEIDTPELITAEMQGRTAVITVRVRSEQVRALRDSSGAVIEGDAEKPAQLTEVWTFSRNTRSRDPNWFLIETRSEA
jgi:predicted lipid-binding transport protein (Tim44 family)